jgi:hypothetical protein
MAYGPQFAREQAIKAAERRLKEAVTFSTLNIKNPIFQRRMGKGHSAVLVRLEWPGVLSVLDPDTGKVLAVSEPGRPDVLRADFAPACGGNYQGGRNGQATN